MSSALVKKAVCFQSLTLKERNGKNLDIKTMAVQSCEKT